MRVYVETFSSYACQFTISYVLCVSKIISFQPEEGGIETRDFRSSGLLHSVDWQLVKDVSGQPIASIFEDQAKHKQFCHCSLYNIPEGRGSL
jgi:hypothetical protein